MEPVGDWVASLTAVRRMGATKPPRLPRELINPMPAAAADPARNAVGYDHTTGPTARKLQTARVMKIMPSTGWWLVPAHAEPKMHRPVERNRMVPNFRRLATVSAALPMK